MPPARFFEWVLIGALGSQACVAFGRAVLLRRRGVNVLAADRQRTPAQLTIDSITLVVFIAWGWALCAFLVPAPSGLRLRLLDEPILQSPVARCIGAAMVVAQLALYTAAVLRMGSAWRLGVDRHSPGPLVTTGVFALSRNSIYIAIDLLLLGSFLILGRLVLLLLGAVMIVLIHLIILREERFLAERFGQAYADYCARTGRYLSWPRRRRGRAPPPL